MSLSINAPSQYPAGVPLTIYMTMTNTSSVNGTNLVYAVPSATNYTGVSITIDPNGAGQNCTNIKAGASCTFSATIPAGSHPGSFTVVATPNGGKNQSNKSLQAGNLQASNSISVTANLGLVNIPPTSNSFYILPAEQVVASNSDGTATAYVSVLVQSGAAAFDSLKLVDELGVELSSYQLIGSLSTTHNSVNTYKVTIPAGKSAQDIQAFSYNAGAAVCTTLNIGSNNLSACSNNALANVVANNVGILAIQPNYFNMSDLYESQVVTVSNIGNGAISGLTLPAIAAPFSIAANNCTTALAVGASCQLTLIYTPNGTSGQGSFVINYNNGSSNVNTAATIPYGLAPRAILTASPTSFSLSNNKPVQIITLSNTGNTAATGLTLPTLTSPLQESVIATTCTATLAESTSCVYVVYINYQQGVATAGSQTLAFNYNNGIQAQTTNVAADWAMFATFPWAWEGGLQTGSAPANYGTINVSSVSNYPGSLGYGISWVDNNGDFWLFGGKPNSNGDLTNAAWVYSRSTKQWTWMSGESTLNSLGNYGTQGVTASSNSPRARWLFTGQFDKKNNVLWVFGGAVKSSNTSYLNDLWKYDLTTKQWTWMSGESVANNSVGNFGSKGVSSASNTPPALTGGSSWLDSSGNFWIYGGANSSWGYYSALWKYDVSLNQWVWVSGSNQTNQNPTYGTLGQACASATCQPGNRYFSSSWTGVDGNFYFFGGYTGSGVFADMWRYNPQADQWTWLNGSQTVTYGPACPYCNWGVQGVESASNVPSGRAYGATWTESNGMMWMMGGEPAVFATSEANDLWRYNPSNNQWTWSSGSKTDGGAPNFYGVPSVFGTLGVSSLANGPGSREGQFAWVGLEGSLWLYGGNGCTTNCNPWPQLGDLWSYRLK